jgi:hypothetical protein
MDFFLFILVNATLFIRPPEVVPRMQDFQLYLYLIIPCLLLSLPVLLDQLRGDMLAVRPITVCVLGLLAAVFLSQLARLDMDNAATETFMFAKVVAYYLLFVAIVNSPERLRRFLFWLVLFATGSTLLAVLRYHGVIELATQTLMLDRRENAWGDEQFFVRLCGTGIFQDPNDFTLLLVMGIPLALYWLTDEEGGPLRLAWLLPLGLFFYALSLTQSRGGMLAVLLGLAVLFRARFGLRRSLLLLGLCLPVFFLALGGRQTELNSEDTAQERFRLWSDGLDMFKASPVLGVGAGEFKKQVTEKLVAHNSFVHAYAELGLMGGTLLVGAFAFGLWMLYLHNRDRTQVLDPRLRRMQPYVLATVAGYAGAMLTLSHVYTVTTYTMLGLVTVYLRLTMALPPLPVPRLSGRVARGMALASVGFLTMTYVMVRVFVRWR